MLNDLKHIFKYSSIKIFRDRKKRDLGCPTFLFSRKYKLNYEGNRLILDWPSSSYGESGTFVGFRGKWTQDNIRDELIWGKSVWSSAYCACFGWQVNAPWFYGEQASIYTDVQLLSAKNISEEISLFNPSTFEYYVDLYFREYYRATTGSDKNRKSDSPFRFHILPVQWQPIIGSNTPAVTYKSFINGNGSPYWNLLVALSENTMACISIQIAAAMAVTEWLDGRVHKEFDTEPMITFIEELLQRVTVKLSPESQAKLDAVKQQFPDANISETFNPIKWEDQTDEEYMEYFQPLIDTGQVEAGAFTDGVVTDTADVAGPVVDKKLIESRVK